jgi:predicted DNA-binding WGR domain protein
MSENIGPLEKVHLLHESGKFWEVSNEGSKNVVRFGRISKGQEKSVKTKISDFGDMAQAIRRADQLIIEKKAKGYQELDPKNYSDEYFERNLQGTHEFQRVTRRDNQIKIEICKGGQPPIVNIANYPDDKEAHAEAKKIARKLLQEGYAKNESKLNSSLQTPPISRNGTADLDIEIIENEDLPARKSNAPTHRKISEESKKPQLKPSSSLDFSFDDGPVKRKRGNANSIQEMLASINLSKFVLNFEQAGYNPDSLLTVTHKDLGDLNIPPSARQIILNSIRNNAWNAAPGDYISQDDEVVKRIKLDGSFELGRSAPKDRISLLLAKVWEESIDPTGWWMSEKLDGVRCYWNGRNFITRNGNIYKAPKFFTACLPRTVSLDGELWMGRKMFQKCVGIAKRQQESHDENEWKQLIYILFDAPSIHGPFEKRYEYIHNLDQALRSPYVRALEHVKCLGKDHLEEELEKVNKLGGEGIMLRQPGSMYENKRSDTLLKVKTFLDAEATVIEHVPGTGRCSGMMGALRVRTDDGRIFKIGTGFNDDQRRRPPKIGARVTYKYQELSNSGTPRFPVFLRIHPGI